MRIRRMSIKDIPDVRIMMKDLQDSHAEMLPEVFKPGVLRAVAYYEQIISDKERTILVAVDDTDTPIGFVKGKIVDFPGSEMLRARRYGYVDGIFVKKNYRGKLVEFKLQKELFSWFKSYGISHVEANVYDSNERAKEYYQLFGYSYVKHGLQIDL